MKLRVDCSIPIFYNSFIHSILQYTYTLATVNYNLEKFTRYFADTYIIKNIWGTHRSIEILVDLLGQDVRIDRFVFHLLVLVIMKSAIIELAQGERLYIDLLGRSDQFEELGIYHQPRFLAAKITRQSRREC